MSRGHNPGWDDTAATERGAVMTCEKFTKGKFIVDGTGCVRHDGTEGASFIKTSSPWQESVWDDDPEAHANGFMLAAALNAANAAEELGYDGQRAIEELPRLLEACAVALKALEYYSDTPSARDDLAAPEMLSALLTACRVKEASDD